MNLLLLTLLVSMQSTDLRMQADALFNDQQWAELIPVLDDFERANNTNEKDVKGYRLIGQKMLDILSKHNLKKIYLEKDTAFDLDKHEAISSVTVKEKKKKGKIIEEVEPGYMLTDKIIRYPKVIIGK